MYLKKDLTEDKLCQLIDQFNKKIIIELFSLCYLTIYIHFMMEMGELVRYYLLSISIRGYNYNKTCIAVNKGI